MKIGVIGSGVVGKTLARRISQARPRGDDRHARGGQARGLGGRASDRESRRLRRDRRLWRGRRPGGRRRGGARSGEAVGAAKSTASRIDATNPIGGGPPVHGVLSFFTSLTTR